MENEQLKVRPTLANMKVGESITFPIEKMKSIRTQATEIGAIMGVTFKTKTNRIERTIEVKRIS